MDPYIAQVLIFAGNFAPRDWAFCDGQLISIEENTALFALIGTIYGGNGQNSFGLPDLRGRVPVGTGSNSPLGSIPEGQAAGSETVTLTLTQIPSHTHTLKGVTEVGTSIIPTGNFLANTGALDREYALTGTQTDMNAGAISTVGENQPHTNMQPYLALNYVICLYGIFPSRN
jgi:microcystin-dependent protein